MKQVYLSILLIELRNLMSQIKNMTCIKDAKLDCNSKNWGNFQQNSAFQQLKNRFILGKNEIIQKQWSTFE